MCPGFLRVAKRLFKIDFSTCLLSSRPVKRQSWRQGRVGHCYGCRLVLRRGVQHPFRRSMSLGKPSGIGSGVSPSGISTSNGRPFLHSSSNPIEWTTALISQPGGSRSLAIEQQQLHQLVVYKECTIPIAPQSPEWSLSEQVHKSMSQQVLSR